MNQKASPAALASARMTDAPPQDAVDIGAPAGEALPACVLLVEDDLVSQRVARRHLEQMGYVVVVADDEAACSRIHASLIGRAAVRLEAFDAHRSSPRGS